MIAWDNVEEGWLRHRPDDDRAGDDLLELERTGHGRRHRPIDDSAVAELAGEVRAPAVRIAGSSQSAGIQATERELTERQTARNLQGTSVRHRVDAADAADIPRLATEIYDLFVTAEGKRRSLRRPPHAKGIR